SAIDSRAPKYFEPEQLKVFDKLPEDQINTKIHETFVARAAAPKIPADKDVWPNKRDEWANALKTRSFVAGYHPRSRFVDVFKQRAPQARVATDRDGMHFAAYDLMTEQDVHLRIYVLRRASLQKPKLVVLNVLDEATLRDFLATARPKFEDLLVGEDLPK